MTENRGNIFISRCPWWFPKSLILIESECWGRGVRWGPGHAIPHLQDHNHRHYEVLLSCLLVNRPPHWLTSVTQGLWLARARPHMIRVRKSGSPSLSASLCSVFSHNNNFLNRNIPPRPGSCPSPLPILSRVLCWLHHWVSPNRFTTRSNL